MYNNIIILTGAGVSKASGVRTFRGTGGLWNDPENEKYSKSELFKQEPLLIWQFFGKMRKEIQNVKPNDAHYALAKLENHAPSNFLLLTQNIDGLHQKAGSKNLIELHGNIFTTKCSNPECNFKKPEDYDTYEEHIPICGLCGSNLRPAIVLFGEYLDTFNEHRTKVALRDCDLFVSVGTSGTVAPASNFVRGAEYAGAETIFINTEPTDNTYFQKQIIGNAEDVLPKFVLEITKQEV